MKTLNFDPVFKKRILDGRKYSTMRLAKTFRHEYAEQEVVSLSFGDLVIPAKIIHVQELRINSKLFMSEYGLVDSATIFTGDLGFRRLQPRRTAHVRKLFERLWLKFYPQNPISEIQTVHLIFFEVLK